MEVGEDTRHEAHWVMTSTEDHSQLGSSGRSQSPVRDVFFCHFAWVCIGVSWAYGLMFVDPFLTCGLLANVS